MLTLQGEFLDTDGLGFPCGFSTVGTWTPVGNQLHLNAYKSAADPPTASVSGWPLLFYAYRKREFRENTLPEVTLGLLHRWRHAVAPVPGPLRPTGWHSS